ncbi:MAG: hypothetical protein IJA67_07790 [Oscillospiraceae bacterium]|nr:hypothetical protein [Oscillospiraceae bacterium]
MYGYTPYGKSYDDDEEYSASMKLVQELREKLPAYTSDQAQSLQELYREITERPKFTYDPNDDALYQSYKQTYAQQGRLAMEDTMGQAAGLTGGYGSSYAQGVGQQQYDAYLQKLTDIYPELYSMAYGRYLDEGEALRNEYDLLFQQSEADYAKYRDLLADAYGERDYWQERADTAYDRETAAEKDAYNREQKAYDRLVEMMTTMGYVPTGEELAAAGMSEQHRDAYLRYYNSLQTAGGGGRGGKKDDKEEDAYDSALAAARARLAGGANVEEVNGEIAQKVARGELDAETARKLIGALTKEYYG